MSPLSDAVLFLKTFFNKKDIQIVQCYVQYSKIENLWSSAGVANPDPGEQNFALTLIKHTWTSLELLEDLKAGWAGTELFRKETEKVAL